MARPIDQRWLKPSNLSVHKMLCWLSLRCSFIPEYRAPSPSKNILACEYSRPSHFRAAPDISRCRAWCFDDWWKCHASQDGRALKDHSMDASQLLASPLARKWGKPNKLRKKSLAVSSSSPLQAIVLDTIRSPAWREDWLLDLSPTPCLHNSSVSEILTADVYTA